MSDFKVGKAKKNFSMIWLLARLKENFDIIWPLAKDEEINLTCDT